MLDEERAYFDEHLPDWLQHYPGKYIVVRGNELVGTFDTQEQALSEGARRFGLSSFLVRQVLESNPEVRIPALTLGLLNADSQRSVAGSGTGSER